MTQFTPINDPRFRGTNPINRDSNRYTEFLDTLRAPKAATSVDAKGADLVLDFSDVGTKRATDAIPVPNWARSAFVQLDGTAFAANASTLTALVSIDGRVFSKALGHNLGSDDEFNTNSGLLGPVDVSYANWIQLRSSGTTNSADNVPLTICFTPHASADVLQRTPANTP